MSTDGVDREFRAINASLQSLQEQVDNLYAQVNALRSAQEHSGVLQHGTSSYPIHPSLEHENTRNPFRDVQSSSQQEGRHPQFQGPTSSAYSFEVANSSLQTMGITQPVDTDEQAKVLEKNSLGPASQNQVPPAPIMMHPNKDPLWSISKDEAVRLCRVYDDEMGIMYPVVDIEHTISRAKFLFTFTESATRTGLIRTEMPGRDGLGTDDNNILKMVLATALTVEGHGESQLGRRLFESVRDTSQNRLWAPVELKGLSLLVIVVGMRGEIQEFRCSQLAGTVPFP